MDPFSVVSTENYGKKSLVTGLLLVVAAHFVFRFIQSLIEYRVRLASIGLVLFLELTSRSGTPNSGSSMVVKYKVTIQAR